ncbi:MAG: aldolase/citrate lyase family protein [Chloroflexota bacterium]
MMRKNRLRELLNEGKPSLGTHVNINEPTIVELAGYSGMFDYVEFVGEYAPYDLHTLENLARASEKFDNFSTMIKLDQAPRLYLGVRSIGAGIQNLLFADVRTVEDAWECVKSTRAEAPGHHGLHGVGMRRDVSFVIDGGSPQWIEYLDDVVIALMIEKKEAVENLEAILSVPTIDMVQFGGSDYSMSLGLAGQRAHPAVMEAEKYTIETALKMGKHPRIELMDPSQAGKYLDMGVKHFCMGWDVRVLYDYFKGTGSAMRELLEGRAAAPAAKGAGSADPYAAR